MKRKIFVGIIIISVFIGTAFGGGYKSRWYMPKLNSAYMQIHDALIGEDIYVGASLGFGSFLKIEPNIYTYQFYPQWHTYGGVLQLKYRPMKKFAGNWIIWAGGMSDNIDLTQVDSIGAGLNATTYSRFMPTFGFGGEVDSVPFFCRGCGYYFTGRFLLGDFIPIYREFDNLNSASPETLSTVIIGDIEVQSPFGSVSALRHLRMRHWFGDDYWRFAYSSPYCCGGILRGTVGWESNYLGFADIEVKIKPFQVGYIIVSTGVKIPTDASLWMWKTGIEFRPSSSKSVSHTGKIPDVEILAPKVRSPYE
ncbi:hypothetical protein J7L68_04870 [bacterium]|nr:hypothetical protein [bacterium]